MTRAKPQANIGIEVHNRTTATEDLITVAPLEAPVDMGSVELVLVSDANLEV